MLLLLLCSSISFRHTTHRRFCLGSLSTISLYHAKYVILTLMLATPYALVCLPCAGVIVVGLGSLKFWCTLAQEILPRKLEYYLPLPCQKRHIDFDACYFLCSSLFALCRSDSCWVMEFKVLVYSSLNWPNFT